MRRTTLLLIAGLAFGHSAAAQNTDVIIETGTVTGSVGKGSRGYETEQEMKTVVDQGDAQPFGQGDTPTAREAADRLLSPDAPALEEPSTPGVGSGVSANPPRPTARPKPPERAPTSTTDRPRHVLNGAANPLIVAAPVHLALPEGTPNFEGSGFEAAQGATIVPAEWIWERGGWAWTDAERSARLADPTLLQAAGSTPGGWSPTGQTGPAGWLPKGSNACIAAQRIEFALKAHRLAMTPEEQTDWTEAKSTACMRSYVLR
jgi:hypothetical protein